MIQLEVSGKFHRILLTLGVISGNLIAAIQIYILVLLLFDSSFLVELFQEMDKSLFFGGGTVICLPFLWLWGRVITHDYKQNTGRINPIWLTLLVPYAPLWYVYNHPRL